MTKYEYTKKEIASHPLMQKSYYLIRNKHGDFSFSILNCDEEIETKMLMLIYRLLTTKF